MGKRWNLSKIDAVRDIGDYIAYLPDRGVKFSELTTLRALEAERDRLEAQLNIAREAISGARQRLYDAVTEVHCQDALHWARKDLVAELNRY